MKDYSSVNVSQRKLTRLEALKSNYVQRLINFNKITKKLKAITQENEELENQIIHLKRTKMHQTKENLQDKQTAEELRTVKDGLMTLTSELKVALDQAKSAETAFITENSSKINISEFYAFLKEKRAKLSSQITVSSGNFSSKHEKIAETLSSIKTKIKRKISINDLESGLRQTEKIETVEEECFRLSLDETGNPIVARSQTVHPKVVRQVPVKLNKTFYMVKEKRRKEKEEREASHSQPPPIQKYRKVKPKYKQALTVSKVVPTKEKEEISKYSIQTWTREPEPAAYKSRFFN